MIFSGAVSEKIMRVWFTENNETNKNSENVTILSMPVCWGGGKAGQCLL